MKKNTRRRTGAAATINPDHVAVHRLIVAGVVIALLAAIATSWAGLMWVGEQQLLPAELRWLTPVMIDVPLVVLTVARGALMKRGIPTRGLIVGIVALTAFSSAANAAHTLTVAGFATLPALLGASTNALAPWLILAMTEVLWLVVTKQRGRVRAKARPAAARRTSPRRVRSVRPVESGQALPGLAVAS